MDAMLWSAVLHAALYSTQPLQPLQADRDEIPENYKGKKLKNSRAALRVAKGLTGYNCTYVYNYILGS